jgi:hypothetical protein
LRTGRARTSRPEGDFASAGAVHLDVFDRLDKNFAQVEVGSFGHRRAATGVLAPVGVAVTALVVVVAAVCIAQDAIDSLQLVRPLPGAVDIHEFAMDSVSGDPVSTTPFLVRSRGIVGSLMRSRYRRP